MKAQMHSLPIIMILAVVIVGLTALYFYMKSAEVSVSVNQIEHANFVRNLDKKVNEYSLKNKGSSEVISLNVPDEMKQVCFVDRKGEFKRFSSPALDIQLTADESNNLFFEPKEFSSASLNRFNLEENPLCVSVNNKRINLKLESEGNVTKISAASDEDVEKSKCTALVYNGDESEKIDLAFIGHGYEDSSKLSNEIIIYIDQVFGKITPLNTNIGKFNFYQVNDDFKDCTISYKIDCNSLKLKKAVSVCPNDYTIVLAERSEAADLVNPVRSSQMNDLIKINSADNKLVFAHEFGHLIANLADEYTDDPYYGSIGLDVDVMPNCDNVECEKWKNVENASCFKGCSVSAFYRPTENSIMNIYWKAGGDVYGPVNEIVINKVLGVYE